MQEREFTRLVKYVFKRSADRSYSWEQQLPSCCTGESREEWNRCQSSRHLPQSWDDTPQDTENSLLQVPFDQTGVFFPQRDGQGAGEEWLLPVEPIGRNSAHRLGEKPPWVLLSAAVCISNDPSQSQIAARKMSLNHVTTPARKWSFWGIYALKPAAMYGEKKAIERALNSKDHPQIIRVG